MTQDKMAFARMPLHNIDNDTAGMQADARHLLGES